jgi:hypothetical protein
VNVLEAAAEHIAVTMIRAAFEHLPPERAAGALAMADTEPIQRMLQASVVEAYSQGREAGVRQGRLELRREMEDDWKPLSERIRNSAGTMTRAERESEAERRGGDYRGGPVDPW